MNERLSTSLQSLKKLSLVLSVIIFINILFGPLVRATNSGLACPDWPLCYGKVVPPPEFQIWMEVGHRIYSGILGIFLILIMVTIFRKKELRDRFLFAGVFAVIVLMVQVILGALTVTRLLDPGTVNMHLLNAVLLFSIIVSIFLKSKYLLDHSLEETSTVNLSLLLDSRNWLLFFSVILIFFQLFMGGRVSSNYAGLACADWPTCHGEFFPELEGLVKYQVQHRYVAYLIFVLLLITLVVSFIHPSYDKKTKIYIRMSFYTILLQIGIGVTNVLLKLPTLLTALHTGIGVLLFITVYMALFYRLVSFKKALPPAL